MTLSIRRPTAGILGDLRSKLTAKRVAAHMYLAREVRGLYLSMEEVEMLKKIAAQAEERTGKEKRK